MKVIDDIKNDLIKKLSFGASINYEKFYSFYKPYLKILPEIIFATEVMKINYSNFHSLKYSHQNIIVNPIININEDLIKKVKILMIKKYSNQKLSYEVFKNIDSKL